MKQVPIVMPQMGQSVAEGTILRWLKNVGDDVAADEILFEVETDKANVEVESPAAGRLASCLKQAGEVAAAGEVVGYLETEADVVVGETPPPPSAASAPHAGADQEAVLVEAEAGALSGSGGLPEIDRNHFSPYVLRLALLNHVTLEELQTIRGTGRGGRVTKYDLLQYLARRPLAARTIHALTGKLEVSEKDLSALGEVIPMSALRKTIADHMVQSIRTSAHVTMVHAVDMTHVVELRQRIKDAFAERYGAKLTYTAVMIFVTSRVLRDFPRINACVHGTNIILRKEINIGCAVALADETLVVPVVHQADRRSFPEIAQELGRLIARARRKELRRADVEGGTFTVSNFGAFGSIIGTPIIHQPQVAILGMGAVHKAPVAVDGTVCVRDQLYLSLTFDHRIIDGDLGGRFLHALERLTATLSEEALFPSAP